MGEIHMYQEFLQYLEEKPSFKSGRYIKASAKHYANAIRTISDEMIEVGMINESIYNIIDVCLLDKVIIKIMKNKNFIEKNQRGDNMYSNALEHFQYFRHYM